MSKILSVKFPVSTEIDSSNNPKTPSGTSVFAGNICLNINDGREAIFLCGRNKSSRILVSDISTNNSSVSSHLSDFNNPHNVTKENIGLGNCDNTSDVDKPLTNLIKSKLPLKFGISDVVPYDQLSSNSEDVMRKTLLAASAGLVLSDTVKGLSNIDDSIKEYSSRIKALEDAFGI